MQSPLNAWWKQCQIAARHFCTMSTWGWGCVTDTLTCRKGRRTQLQFSWPPRQGAWKTSQLLGLLLAFTCLSSDPSTLARLDLLHACLCLDHHIDVHDAEEERSSFFFKTALLLQFPSSQLRNKKLVYSLILSLSACDERSRLANQAPISDKAPARRQLPLCATP